jgi:L-threonylcarbamoyladenylate synthase
MPIVLPADTAAIAEAARLLEAGRLVALPTETVYGLAADADAPQAVARIFAAKGRPQDHPLILHVAQALAARGLEGLAPWIAALPPAAAALAARFWPGPLTLVLPRRPGAAEDCAAGQPTVALRCPAHPVAQALLARFRGGRGALAAPSANRFGRISPTMARHVAEEFEGAAEPALILDGGACPVGIESTIVDCSHAVPIVLRPGMLTREALQDALGGARVALRDEVDNPALLPRVSGSLNAHYAPQAELRLVPHDAWRATLAAAADEAAARGGRLASLGFGLHGAALHVPMPQQPAAYAHALYASLRRLDAQAPALILVELPHDPTPEWAGVLDRLRRAAHRG